MQSCTCIYEHDFSPIDKLWLILSALNHLSEWTKPEPLDVPLVNKMDSCFTVSEPLGLALVIGAWNYPIQLTIMPLIGAIAAGEA